MREAVRKGGALCLDVMILEAGGETDLLSSFSVFSQGCQKVTKNATSECHIGTRGISPQGGGIPQTTRVLSFMSV